MAVSEKGNKEWTIQRYCQHWAYKTQDKDKNTTLKTTKMINMDPTKTPGMSLGAREG